MHDGLPHRRRQARAIAISATLNERRRALVARVALALATAALTLQAMFAAHSYLATAHS